MQLDIFYWPHTFYLPSNAWLIGLVGRCILFYFLVLFFIVENASLELSFVSLVLFLGGWAFLCSCGELSLGLIIGVYASSNVFKGLNIATYTRANLWLPSFRAIFIAKYFAIPPFFSNFATAKLKDIVLRVMVP